jgi:hypothetical protein
MFVNEEEERTKNRRLIEDLMSKLEENEREYSNNEKKYEDQVKSLNFFYSFYFNFNFIFKDRLVEKRNPYSPGKIG